MKVDLFSIILRFRTHNYVLTADIVKMYRQVVVNHEHRDLQRIIWRPWTQDDLQYYQLNTVTYGTTSAAFLVTRGLKEIANQNINKYPLISNLILSDFYVDDLLSGASTINDAIYLLNNLDKMLKGYGFDLRKWCSNNQTVLKAISENKSETSQ